MSHSLGVLTALLLVCAALAAPAPEPFVSGWGNPVNPERDCKIKRDRGTLTIEMPGSDHDYDPVRKQFNAPRLFRDMEGDFELRVRVRIDSRPSPRSTDKGQPSFVSAGFLLIYPEISRTTCIRLEYGLSQPGIGLDAYAVAPRLASPQRERAPRKGLGEDGFVAWKFWYCKHRQPDKTWDRTTQDHFQMLCDRGWKEWPLPRMTDSAYLRLEQKRGWIHFSMSLDGEKWTLLEGQPKLPAKCKIGLAAFSTSSDPSKVRFDQLKLTRGKKKEPLGGPSINKASLSLPSLP